VYNATRDKEGLLVADGKTSAAFPSSWDELFSGDSNKIISIQNSANDDGLHRVVIYDLNLKSLGTKELHAGQFVYNKERNRIAGIAVSNGKTRVVELSIDQPDMIKEGPLYDEIMFPSFGPDGTSLAYFAAKGGKSYLVLNEKEEPIPAAQVHNPPLIRPDGKGAGIILHTKNGFVFRQAFVGKETIEKMYDEAAQPVYSGDGSRYAYIAKQKKRIFLVVNGKECPAFDMVVSPLFSPDGKFIVYRARKDGKRFVVVADASGKILKQHPAYEQVFQPVFSPDGKSVAYGVKDGNKLVWTVEKLQ
jgi:WD40 repeat protein